MKLARTDYLNLSKLDITEFLGLDSICKMFQATGKDTVIFFSKYFCFQLKKKKKIVSYLLCT